MGEFRSILGHHAIRGAVATLFAAALLLNALASCQAPARDGLIPLCSGGVITWISLDGTPVPDGIGEAPGALSQPSCPHCFSLSLLGFALALILLGLVQPTQGGAPASLGQTARLGRLAFGPPPARAPPLS